MATRPVRANAQPPDQALPPLFIAGPTATGKSDLALDLAERLSGEIISVDSMQVYRGLDIGTAKPTPEERKRIPHHLIDILSLRESFDAAQFVRTAAAAAAAVRAKHHVPLFCGGTGLYFKAYLHGLGEAPPADPAIRAELTGRPLRDLLDELRERDPDTYHRIDQKNPRRVIRALEVIRLSGKPYHSQRADWNPNSSTAQPKLFILTRHAEDLTVRIDRRVEAMFASGLIEETRALLDKGLARHPSASQAIGYRQVIEHLRGQYTFKETVCRVQQRTRQFAKRQLTWFRHQLAGTWLVWEAGQSREYWADYLLQAYSHQLPQ